MNPNPQTSRNEPGERGESPACETAVPLSKDAMSANNRKKKLIEPRLQLKVGLSFLGAAGAGVLIQTIMLAWVLNRTAYQLPNDTVLLLEKFPTMLGSVLLVTFLFMAPLFVSIGISTMFPIVGPLHRLRTHLRSVIDGEQPAPCRLRKGDELHDLCDLINRALEHERAAAKKEQEEKEEPEPDRKAA